MNNCIRLDVEAKHFFTHFRFTKIVKLYLLRRGWEVNVSKNWFNYSFASESRKKILFHIFFSRIIFQNGLCHIKYACGGAACTDKVAFLFSLSRSPISVSRLSHLESIFFAWLLPLSTVAPLVALVTATGWRVSGGGGSRVYRVQSIADWPLFFVWNGTLARVWPSRSFNSGNKVLKDIMVICRMV